MGKTVRSCLVLSLTTIAIVATTAWADRPTRQACAERCSEFTARLVGNEGGSAALNRRQRKQVMTSMRQLARECLRLCGFGVVEIDTLAELVAALRDSQDGSQDNSDQGSGEQSSMRPSRGPSSRPTAPAPGLSSPPPVTAPVVSLTPPPGTSGSLTPIPNTTPAPNPTVVVTVAPEVTSAPGGDGGIFPRPGLS